MSTGPVWSYNDFVQNQFFYFLKLQYIFSDNTYDTNTYNTFSSNTFCRILNTGLYL